MTPPATFTSASWDGPAVFLRRQEAKLARSVEDAVHVATDKKINTVDLKLEPMRG